MPPQSPAAGALAVPSPFTSPAAVASSGYEVNTMGVAGEPASAVITLSARRAPPRMNMTTVPGPMSSGALTRTYLVTTYTCALVQLVATSTSRSTRTTWFSAAVKSTPATSAPCSVTVRLGGEQV